MPIRAENKGRYPKEWPTISLWVRVCAGWRCEWCDAIQAELHPITGSRVVLTVAHVHDHSPENCTPSNLAALCQRCHLNHDRAHHMANSAETRWRKRPMAALLDAAMPDPTTPPAAAHYSDPRCDICGQLMEYSAGMWICTSEPSCCESPSPVTTGLSAIMDAALRESVTIVPEIDPATHAAALRVVEAARVFTGLVEECRADDNGGGPTGSDLLGRTVDAEDALIEALAAFDAAKKKEPTA